jgi:hypothetical protein
VVVLQQHLQQQQQQHTSENSLQVIRSDLRTKRQAGITVHHLLGQSMHYVKHQSRC